MRRLPILMNGQRVGGIILLLLGVGFGLLAIMFAVQKVPLILRGVKTTGTVVSLDMSARPGRRFGVVEFRDRSGMKRTMPTTSPKHNIGDVVQVLYLPSRPARAAEHSYGTTWASLIVLPLLSAFLITGGTKLFGRGTDGTRRRRRR